MDELNNPLDLALIVILSVLSLYYCTRGFRERDVPEALLGIGLGIPPFAIGSFKCWLVGGAVCAFALWLKKRFESV